MRIGKTDWWRAGTFVLVGAAAFMAYAPPATTQSSTPPQYDADGNLLRPVGFETWVFVGSNLGLAYQGEPQPPPQPRRQEFHNVYMSPQAHAEFVKTQTFPDLTVFVIDRLTAKDREPKDVVSAGVYNNKRLGIEVAVKNLNRPRPEGSTTPWAYYQFPMGGNPPKLPERATAEKGRTCENCHAKVNAKTDNVWVRFYPILRDLMK